MQEILLFSDCSIHPQSKIGFGAYLMINPENTPLTALRSKVHVRRFEDTSSTKLELQTLLWALSQLDKSNTNIISHTDSQNIISLLERQARLEKNNYYTSKGTLIANHELYKTFFQVKDRLNIQFKKIKGHKPSQQKTSLDDYFTLVDRASRKALRKYIQIL